MPPPTPLPAIAAGVARRAPPMALLPAISPPWMDMAELVFQMRAVGDGAQRRCPLAADDLVAEEVGVAHREGAAGDPAHRRR